MLGKYASLNGKIIKTKNANLPIDTIELMYGFGVYENLKLRNNQLFFAEDHANRLIHSAEQIGLEHDFKATTIVDWIKELIAKNKIDSANLKMILLGGETPKLFIFMLNPLYLEKKDYREGVKVISENYERFAPTAKTLNMLPSYIIYQKAKSAGAFDAILIDRLGNITEGTRSNFFAIKNTTLYTHPVSEVLDGITRKTVIDCAIQNNYELKEEVVPLKNIFDYDGAFLTNTSGKIIPIKTIDDRSFDQIPDKLQELRKLYNKWLSMNND